MSSWRSRVKSVGIAMTLAAAVALVVATQWFQRSDPAVDTPGPQTIELTRDKSRDDHVPSAAAPGDSELILPVAGVRAADLVDTFSQARASGARRHDAIDILAARDSLVIAAASGTVEKLFLSKDGGNTVYIRSPDGRRLYYYAHLDRYAPSLAEGARIMQGAPIGTVGSSGNADPAAPHLHFAIWTTSAERKWWENALALNPYPLLTRQPEQTDPE